MQSGRWSVALKQDIDSEIVDNHNMKAYAHLGWMILSDNYRQQFKNSQLIHTVLK